MVLTRYEGGAYDQLPTKWLSRDWIREEENHPGYSALSDEYDYNLPSGKINDLIEYTKYGPNRRGADTPYFQSYYYFAATALYMRLAPEEFGLRNEIRHRLNGRDVVNQVRLSGAPNCTPEGWREEFGKDDSTRLNILNVEYSALWARMFNQDIDRLVQSGQLRVAEPIDHLRTEPRNPNMHMCRCCEAISIPVYGAFVSKHDPEYEDYKQRYYALMSRRKHRNANG